jgi:hypothetical protein
LRGQTDKSIDGLSNGANQTREITRNQQHNLKINQPTNYEENTSFLIIGQDKENLEHNMEQEIFKDLLMKELPTYHKELRQKKIKEGEPKPNTPYIHQELADKLGDIFRFESKHVEFFIKNTNPRIFATRISETIDKVAKHFKIEGANYEYVETVANQDISSLPRDFALVTGFVVISEAENQQQSGENRPTKEDFKNRMSKVIESSQHFQPEELAKSFKTYITQHGQQRILI